MRIVIDGRMMGPRWTGIGLYSRKLIEELPKLDHENEYVVLVDHEQFESWTPAAANFKKILAPVKVYGFGEQINLPRLLKSLQPDLVHFTHFNVPVLYSGRRVVTIHDLTLAEFDVSPGGIWPNLKYQLKRWGMLAALGSAIKATAIITPSESTKSALVKRYGAGLAQKTFVTPEAADYTEPLKTRPLDTTNPVILYVGNFYPYKNLQLVIRAWPEIIKAHPSAKLILAGETPRFRHQLQQLVQKLNLGSSVDLPGFVEPARLPQLYRQATIFAFPSLSEGFGLPPLEAMAAGVPVVAAKASCLPEVLGDAAVLVDPKDPKAWAAEINRLLDDAQALAKLQAAGYSRLQSFSWQTMAAQTLEIYNRLKSS